MKSLYRLVPVLCILASIVAFVSADTPSFAVLTQVKGEVKLIYEDGEPQLVSAGQVLQEGFTLQTGADGRATVVFQDGNLRIVPKNATWSMSTDQASDGSVTARTGKLLSHVLADAGAVFQHDTITGLRAAQKKKAEARMRRTLIKQDASRYESLPEKDLSWMDDVQPAPSASTPSGGSGNFRLQTETSDKGLFDEPESAPMPEPTIIVDSKPMKSDHEEQSPAEESSLSYWLPSADGRLSRKIGGFRCITKDPGAQTLYFLSQADETSGNLRLLETVDGFADTTKPVMQMLKERTDHWALDSTRGPWRPLNFLSDTEETELAFALSELEQLPAETDAETRGWLKARVLLYYGLEAEAWFVLQSLLSDHDDRPLPHIRGPLEELEHKAREVKNSGQ